VRHERRQEQDRRPVDRNRDNQREVLALQTIAVVRQKRAARIQIARRVVIAPYFVFFLYKFS